jgi:CO dehydrogenase/acetyl-CoA synthase gamma subunit (corrinoid Fe-S protein)
VASADLYLDTINFLKYLDKQDCAQCGFDSCEEFIEALRKGQKISSDCSSISANEAYALVAVQNIKELWPEVPLLIHPRPSHSGLFELNSPNAESLVLISGNNEYTEQVLLTVLGTTMGPFFVLFIDTDGHTVDMSMIYKTFTAERISHAFRECHLEEKVSRKEVIIPGLAASLKNDIETLTGWHVRVGPVCAAELPLFLSEIWLPPEEKV